jgi:hypothetical protein
MPRPRFTPPPPKRQQHLGTNPVMAAIAVEQQRQLNLNLGVLMTFADDGKEQRELIANLAAIIGVDAEIAVNVNPDHPAARRLHGTLRTINQMALNGCRWQAIHARVIAEDLDTAHQLAQDYPKIGLAAAPACQALARAILNDKLPPDAIAGAEIYREEGATA